MRYVRLYYLPGESSIIMVDERKLEGNYGIESTIIELTPKSNARIRKRLTMNILTKLRVAHCFNITYLYHNRNRDTMMTREDLIDIGWRNFDRLENPQILIYEP